MSDLQSYQLSSSSKSSCIDTSSSQEAEGHWRPQTNQAISHTPLVFKIAYTVLYSNFAYSEARKQSELRSNNRLSDAYQLNWFNAVDLYSDFKHRYKFLNIWYSECESVAAFAIATDFIYSASFLYCSYASIWL